MLLVFTLIQIVCLAALGLLSWQFMRLRRSANLLEQQLGGLEADRRPVNGLVPPLGAGAELIVIEILNPMALAARESPLALTFAKLTPALVRREVYRQTGCLIEAGLRERGVEADVRICRGA